MARQSRRSGRRPGRGAVVIYGSKVYFYSSSAGLRLIASPGSRAAALRRGLREAAARGALLVVVGGRRGRAGA